MAEVIKTNNETKETRLVFKADIARQLLKAQCRLVDIKPDRANRERTIFCFVNDEHFQNKFNEILNEISDQKARERRKEKKAAETKED